MKLVFIHCDIHIRDGTMYSGPYHIDGTTDKISGCPARAPCVTDLVKAAKTKAKKKGADATRHHAEAMTIEELQKLMTWSEETCPHDHLEVSDSGCGGKAGVLKDTLEHGFVRGFASTAFTLWTRYVSNSIVQDYGLQNVF